MCLPAPQLRQGKLQQGQRIFLTAHIVHNPFYQSCFKSHTGCICRFLNRLSQVFICHRSQLDIAVLQCFYHGRVSQRLSHEISSQGQNQAIGVFGCTLAGT